MIYKILLILLLVWVIIEFIVHLKPKSRNKKLDNPHDEEYFKLVRDVLESGVKSEDRTGTGTISKFGTQSRYDLSKGFPILTTKKVNFNAIKGELLWFLEGNTNANYLKSKYGTSIWDEWKDENGDLGRIYGKQWRAWETKEGHTVDQIKDLIHNLKTNPNSRRHIVSAWNVADIQDMALPPCHTMFQFYVRDGKLSCHLYQRSGDLFLGIPYNIASYSLLTHMIAQVCNLEVGEFIHTIGDAHIYSNHLEQIKEQLSRSSFEAPRLLLNPEKKDIDSFTMDDIMVEGYKSHSALKGKVAV